MVPDNADNILDNRSARWKLPITRKHGHMFLEWDANEVHYTQAELQKLHLHFFHPNVTKLYNFLNRARPQEMSMDTRISLEEIAEACKNCRHHRDRPYRFRVPIPSENVKFNHEVAVDPMWLKGNPLLHIVYTQTHYQNAVLLKGESSQDVLNAFVEGWASVYLGYTNLIGADTGSVFTSRS